MEASPSLLSRVLEFAAAVLGNTWALWGLFSTALPLLTEFVAAFVPEALRAKVERWLPSWLPSTPAHRRAVFVALGAIGLVFAAFQAYDEANEKLRDSQAELAHAKAELAQSRSGEARQQQSAEAGRRQAYVVGRLSKFHSQAMDLWGANVTREQFPRWAQLQEAFVAEASQWVEDNLGAAAKEKLLAKAPFPKISAFRLVDSSQRDRLELLDSIAGNIPDLMRGLAVNPAALGPGASPSLLPPPTPATGRPR